MHSILKWRSTRDSNSWLHSCNKSFYIRRRYQVCLQPMPCGLIGMYWAKCKQSNSHTSLTTLFYISFCLKVIRPCLKFTHWWLWSGDLQGHTETHKISFFPYKQVSGRNGDHEWLRMTNAFILCDLLWKV